MTDKKSKSILITGCSSGIGRIVARGLRARGHLVFASARKSDDVSALIAEGFQAFRLDLECSESICNAVTAVLDYVTFPTYLFGTLKRIFPIKTLDWILRKI